MKTFEGDNATIHFTGDTNKSLSTVTYEGQKPKMFIGSRFESDAREHEVAAVASMDSASFNEVAAYVTAVAQTWGKATTEQRVAMEDDATVFFAATVMRGSEVGIAPAEADAIYNFYVEREAAKWPKPPIVSYAGTESYVDEPIQRPAPSQLMIEMPA